MATAPQTGLALITRGFYKHLRNPSNTGAPVTLIGIGLGIGNWLSLAVLLLVALVLYTLRIRTEDKMLADAFGPAYQAYRKRSWALAPFVW